MHKLQEELNKFNEFKNYFKINHPNYSELDTYGFSLSPDRNSVDILFTALTHGDEVIGIQILNLLLEEIKLNDNLNFRPAFLLNNIEAYNINVRFIESDMNRSFCVSGLNTPDKKRAREIENIISGLKINLLLDLHQTIEPAKSAFAVIPENLTLIELAGKIAPDYPVITFAGAGFSKSGKTLLEYANSRSIPALVYEIGQKGFNQQSAIEFKNIIRGLNIDKLIQKTQGDCSEYFFINNKIPNQNGLKLVSGLSNMQFVYKDQVLAKNINNDEFKCPQDSVIIFPRYDNAVTSEEELALLAIKKVKKYL